LVATYDTKGDRCPRLVLRLAEWESAHLGQNRATAVRHQPNRHVILMVVGRCACADHGQKSGRASACRIVNVLSGELGAAPLSFSASADEPAKENHRGTVNSMQISTGRGCLGAAHRQPCRPCELTVQVKLCSRIPTVHQHREMKMNLSIGTEVFLRITVQKILPGQFLPCQYQSAHLLFRRHCRNENITWQRLVRLPVRVT
jgi:hypothetical protein